MKVELNQDAVDAIFQSIFIEDYKMLKEDIKRLEKLKEPKPYQLEDLAANKKYLSAMKTLMEYYIGFEWKDKVKSKKGKNDKVSKDLPDEL